MLADEIKQKIITFMTFDNIYKLAIEKGNFTCVLSHLLLSESQITKSLHMLNI